MYYFTIVIFNTLQQVPLEFKAEDFCKRKIFALKTKVMAQIIWSTRRLVKVLLGIQQKFYQMSSRAIFLLLDVYQIFTPSKRRLVGSYFSATRRLVENFYQTSSTKSSTRRLVEQKIWANISLPEFWRTNKHRQLFLLILVF